MLLPKPLYEAQPYCYILIGSYFMFFSHSISTTIGFTEIIFILSGVILFNAGAVIWIKRARFRSHSSRHHPTNHYRQPFKTLDQPIDDYPCDNLVPELSYEYLPFLYLLAGYSCVALYQFNSEVLFNPALMFSALIFSASGLIVWAMRGFFRGYHSLHEDHQHLKIYG